MKLVIYKGMNEVGWTQIGRDGGVNDISEYTFLYNFKLEEH